MSEDSDDENDCLSQDLLLVEQSVVPVTEEQNTREHIARQDRRGM